VDLVAVARTVGAEVLRPVAESVDSSAVPRSHLHALAEAGLFGLVVPVQYGGADAAPAVQRAVSEELAAADASTWFVWTQHHTPVRTIVRGSNEVLRGDLLPVMGTGALVAGTAFTHLRRPGPPALVATRAGDGWRFDGNIAWLTSWEVADRFLIAAQHDDDVVWALLPLAAGGAVRVHELPLAAMSATRTVRLELRDVPVDATEVVLVEPLAEWRAIDAARTADTNPAVFGVAREAIDRMGAESRDRGDGAAEAGAGRLAEQLAALRERANGLADSSAPGERLEERARARAAALAFAVRATNTYVASRGGRAMSLTDPAQRLARTAMFLLVQGQTAAGRAATIEAFTPAK
jgi:alkylation response protein AidB-like acyl-CoA dehydrogenase